MATYKCLASGNLVTFTTQVDIDSMKGHSGYERIDIEVPVESKYDLNSVRTDTAFAPVMPEIKRMGRPRKVANV